jgi:hypothetical protein
MPINYKPASGSGSGSVDDDSITLAKMAPGTDGNIFSYDANGDPVAIATGTDGQVLTSTGAGSPPAFENAATGDALVANKLSQFAATTSAELAGVVSDETGSGLLVFGTSPTLVTPALGTPTALVGTNISGTGASFTAGNVTTNANLTGGVTSVGNAATVVTNANLTGGVTSVGNAATVVTNANLTGGVTSVGNAATVVTNANLTGGVTSVGNAATVVTNANLTGHITSTGNAAVLGSFTSLQLSAALTNETGTGAAVFGTSPALSTPTGIVKGDVGLGNVDNTSDATQDAASAALVQTLTGTKTLNGTSSTLGVVLLNAAETTTVTATVPPSTVNFDAATQSVLVYTTNANATWITNLRFSSGTSLNTAMATGQSLSITLMAAQGGTAYLGVVFKIDGTTVTPLWQGGIPTAAGASGTDVYTFTVTKTASATYRVLASMSSFA